MRRSSSASAEMAAPPWPTKADFSNTDRDTPRMVSPQLAAVRPGTGSPVSLYTAEKAPKGVFPLGPRRMVIRSPFHSSSRAPSMALPDQGW